jgi:hypothetical protein
MSTKKSKAGRQEPPTPNIGIFWVVRGKLILLGIPFTEGKGYGDYAIFEPSHHDKWRELQRSGTAPHDCEYEEFPRGRVMFNRQTETFLLLADTCILGNRQMLNQIMQEMKLPKGQTVFDRDSHYRCFRCLGIS